MALDPHQFFENLDTGSGLVVAISGGSDSLALLMLAHAYLKGSGTPLLAVTVDHQLRADAALEAQAVAAFCKAHGIQHRTMVWEGDKPATGISAAAREARYGLLAIAARDIGANIILVGHTLDDQAETVAMRLARNEGAGLAGMAPATLFDGDIWIVRPLLGTRRQALRDYLSARGLAWFDDPSNHNPKFERVRTRQAMKEEVRHNLIERAATAAEDRVRASSQAARLVEAYTSCPSPGLIRIEHEFFADESKGSLKAFRALLATVGGTPHLPDEERTTDLFRRIAERNFLRATLSRAVVDARRGGIFILREARDLPVATVAPGTDLLWDGRFRVVAPAGAGTWTIGPEGRDATEGDDRDGAGAPRSLVRAARAAGPVLRPAGAAGAGVPAVTPVVAPWARFLPEFDLAPAAALGRILGAPALPLAPWKHHIGAEP